MDLGEWTLIDGKLIKVDEVDLIEGQEVIVLTAHELLREILRMVKKIGRWIMTGCELNM